ncbi:MAG: hypothetical protein QXL51_00260 [Candidatus Aenigmatarchaeota archaeon]
MNEEKFIQPPSITKTRIIGFDSQKKVWVVYVNVKEQYMFPTEEEAIEFLKTASLPPRISVVGRLKNSLFRGELIEIIRVFDKFVEAKSLFTDEIGLYRKSDVEVIFPQKRRLIWASKNIKEKGFKFKLGDLVQLIKGKFKNKKGEIEDRWVDFIQDKVVNFYRVKLEDGTIMIAEESNLKKVVSRKASFKYIDLTTNEIKSPSELGVDEKDEGNAPEEVKKDNKSYKKVKIVE